MFYKREIKQLQYEIQVLRGELMHIKLDMLDSKELYSFNVGEEVKILKGTFKIQNRGYSDRGEFLGEPPYKRYYAKFVRQYCLVGIDNQDVIWLEEKELIKKLAEFKCIEENINRS